MTKNIDKILGTVSPLYGALSGQGLFGGPSALMREGLTAPVDEVAPPTKRKRRFSTGGKVRGDGLAKRGKTKGKMR